MVLRALVFAAVFSEERCHVSWQSSCLLATAVYQVWFPLSFALLNAIAIVIFNLN